MSPCINFGILLLALSLFNTPLEANKPKNQKWAFWGKFDGLPSSPSQKLLSNENIDFVVTHRTHPKEHFSKLFEKFPGDHDDSCVPPDPKTKPLPSHMIRTSHNGTGSNPDESFYICTNHMMVALGEVSPYSIAAFFPKQEFDFSKGGTVEFQVSNNARRRRHWWEIVINPRSLMSVAAGPEWAPIEEHYPTERIVFRFFHGFREMQVGTEQQDPLGRVGFATEEDPYRGPWYDRYPTDESMFDRRIQRQHRIVISKDLRSVMWSTETPNGGWDNLSMRLKKPMPFTRGMLLVKTHSYTPGKDGNTDDFTDHWDNIRFSGPKVGRYINYEANENIYLERNGDRQVGDEATNVINVKKVGKKPILFGQVHMPIKGEVLLSINGQKFVEIRPYRYTDGCTAEGWKSFQLTVNVAHLKKGMNSFRWVIGKRSCVSKILFQWIGFSVKSLELQIDR